MKRGMIAAALTLMVALAASVGAFQASAEKGSAADTAFAPDNPDLAVATFAGGCTDSVWPVPPDETAS